MALLETITYQGFPDGSNLSIHPHGIKDTEARYIQDAFVYRASQTDRRGPLKKLGATPNYPYKGVGLVFARDPAGVGRAALLQGDGSHAYLSVLSADLTTTVDISLGGSFQFSPYTIVDANPMASGGVWLGISNTYDTAPSRQDVILWRGANKQDYSTGTITASYGNRVVTGSGTAWLANLAPGMFLMDAGSPEQFIGTVSTVDSDTQVTLEEPPLVSRAAQAYRATSVRGWAPRVTVGSITASTASTAITGSNTKFQAQGVAANWRIFRASDLALVGTVLSVTSNAAIVLAANAAINMQNEDYVAINNAGDYGFSILDATKQKPGFLNTTYAGLQLSANRGIRPNASGEFTNRLMYTDDENPENMDMSTEDGNFIPITSGTNASTSLTRLVSTYNSCLILKEDETFALFGKTPNQFEVRKLLDDGAISGMSAVPYQGGAIWAGWKGIYFYDGVLADNIVQESLGPFYTSAISSFDPHTYRMWAVMDRDHYMLHIERVTPQVPITKGHIAFTPTRFTIVIHVPTRAVTFFSNVDLRGGGRLPGGGGQASWFLVNTASGARICDINTLFDETGLDAFACDGNVAGPDFYIESKRFDAGDALLKKLWKQIMIHYITVGDELKLDTVLGLNDIGLSRATGFPITQYTWDQIALLMGTWDATAGEFPNWESLAQGIYAVRRLKFIKRDQFFAFRIYQKSANNTVVRLGPFALAYKRQRPGRV